MEKEEKSVYELFLKAFSSYADGIESSAIGRNMDVMKVLQVTLGDNPQVFYFDKTQIELTRRLFGGKRLRFCGMYPLYRIKKMQKDIDEAISNALEEIMLSNPLSDYDKLICIYEYLQDHVKYDAKEMENCCKYGKIVNIFSHNAYGALVNKIAVCDGISAAFALLSQKMGFDSTVVGGSALFRTSMFSSHAWNLIRVGEKYYHVDATWDINHKEQTGEYSYEYFCVDDDTICTDHNWDINTTSPCNWSELSFYIRNKCFANSLSELENIFKRYVQSRTSVVRVRISDKILIPDPCDQYIAQCLINVSMMFGRTDGIEFMWNQDTRCFYAKYR